MNSVSTHSATGWGEILEWSEHIFFGLLILSGLAVGIYAVVHQPQIDITPIHVVPVVSVDAGSSPVHG